MRVRRLIVAVLLVAAAISVFVAFSGDDSGAGSAEPTATSAATPLWSVRRVPEPVLDAVGALRLQASLDAAAPGPGTCFVVQSGSHTLAAHDGDTPLIGASS